MRLTKSGYSFTALAFTALIGCGGPAASASTSAASVDLANTEAACQVPVKRVPVLIDTDMAVDDWMAILYMLGRPEVDVKAITVAATGEAHCAGGVKAALGLLSLMHKTGVAVSCGTETPYAGGHDFPDGWRTEADTVLGIALPAPLEDPSPLTAAQLIVDTAHHYQNQLVLLTTGPLTNVADALHAAPSIRHTIRMVYSMGGAVRVPGNVNASVSTIDNTVAEWNIYADPLAAHEVVQSGIHMTFVPLDATNNVPLNEAFVARLAQDHAAPAAEFVYQVLLRKDAFVQSEGWFFWDPLAAAISVDESLATIENMRITVLLSPETVSGQTLETQRGTPVRVATNADEARFKDVFLATLRGVNP